jgi:hypothetical protein
LPGPEKGFASRRVTIVRIDKRNPCHSEEA